MKFLAPALACLALVACGPTETTIDSAIEAPADFMPNILTGNIEAHIRFLASDYLQGRDVGTDGYEIAANYVAAQMQLLGLDPAGDNGGYFAQVPLQDVRADLEFAALTIDGVEAEIGRQALVSTNPSVLESEVTAPLVFVGYGVSAANRDHDDYADIDAAGKIVVVMSGVPDGFPTEERAHHISGRTKLEVAAAHGAVGMISLTEWTEEQVAGFAENYFTLPAVQLTAATGPSGYDTVTVSASVTADLGASLFDGAPMSLADVEAAMSAEDGASFPTFDLPHTATMRQRTHSEPFTAPNVVGMLRGSDPALADEIVVLTAHLDHIGSIHDDMRGRGACRSNDDADPICNGAVDNASGVSIMLETARAFIAQGTPRRSVLFVALAGEEKGLLGSEHFARNPTVPADAMVANVNLDMPVIVYEFDDVIAFGADHSNLGPIAARAAARMDIAVSPDPIPQQSLFVRSDHYNFVRVGVPSLFLMTGFSSPDPRWDEGEGFMGFLNTHYHRQTDELDGELEVLFEQGAKFANINYIIAREIADSDEAPAWNEDSFFGNLYGHPAE
ncbi:M28 family metallopeptidase [Maricaulis salignorans]|uniref:PA domain-containing protein n=1 Tax=Maricaulis salignorans TaxID=144026 RepID=A0A1G9TY11_9PROT|nr:M28 family metallopeptidase [Maricaulis salignorans]SDM52659.1 PA domain-containing protein [Maricaulis salignorans]